MKLPRTLSMRLKSEFVRVRSDGESYGGKHLVLAVLPDPEVPTFKVGFVVPRRVGKAVERNRVKRRLRHIFATTAHRLKPQNYVVTVARKGSCGAAICSAAERVALARRKGGSLYGHEHGISRKGAASWIGPPGLLLPCALWAWGSAGTT